MTVNFILSAALFVGAGVFLYYFFYPNKDGMKEQPDDRLAFEGIVVLVADEINKILNMDVYELRLNESETRKRIQQKSILRDAVRNCCLGDSGKRSFVKEYIKTLLQDTIGVNEVNINGIIPFNFPERMDCNQKFVTLYYILSEQHGNQVFGYLCEDEWGIEKKKEDGIHYEVSENDLDESFKRLYRNLSYYEKLEILTQLTYQDLYGLDVVDIIIADDSIDNCSGGVGGITELDYNYLEEMMEKGQTRNGCHDSIFVMYHGKQIRQSYLSFGSKERLMRVVKNIYRHDAPEMLTAQNGFVVANRKDNTRVTVARPPVSASWAFFLRKFKSVKYSLELLISGNQKELAIRLLKLIVTANETFTISGSPASGKTTMLKALVPYIDPRLSIRMAESVFETMFNVLLPDRNIQVMQERGRVRIPDIINAFKKMDTDITILGEITEPEMAGAFVQIAQSGGKMTMCTLHHETTEKLIEYMRNALMVFYDLKDSAVAEQQIVNILNWDIHMAKDSTGYRFIERITEIIPQKKPLYDGGTCVEECMKGYFQYRYELENWRPYITRDVLVFDQESRTYTMPSPISREGMERIMSKLSVRERYEFNSLLGTGGENNG